MPPRVGRAGALSAKAAPPATPGACLYGSPRQSPPRTGPLATIGPPHERTGAESLRKVIERTEPEGSRADHRLRGGSWPMAALQVGQM